MHAFFTDLFLEKIRRKMISFTNWEANWVSPGLVGTSLLGGGVSQLSLAVSQAAATAGPSGEATTGTQIISILCVLSTPPRLNEPGKR